ncbi:MAG: type VI secretion system-associated protein TagF [Burkholderiales bacterium]
MTFEIGWFGKLPCAGDFIYRRMPRDLLGGLDNWLQQGLSQLRGTYPAEWRGIYDTAPTWNCAIPSTVTQAGRTLVGLITPSRDRVGREFPLCAGVAVPEGEVPTALLATAHDWLQQLGRLVAQAKARPSTVDAFDAAVASIALPSSGRAPAAGGPGDILSILNMDDASEDVPTIPMPLAHSLPWPDLPRIFDDKGVTSFWWTNTGAGGPLRGFTTDVGLAPSLMLTLMRPQFAAKRAS